MRSCTQSETARKMGISTTGVYILMKARRFETVKVMGKRRILLSSLRAAMRYLVIEDEDILHPKRRGFARLTPEKLAEISSRGGNRVRQRAMA